MDGLINALGPLGNEMIYWQVPDNSMQASQMIAEQLEKGKTDVVITLDVTALELAAQAISGSYTESVKLFGIGSTGRVASFIEQGTISATIVQNDFGIGYLGVKSAVDAIEARPVASAFEVEHRLINIKNMYDTENQRLLFPFIR
jgi:ribose transport system substrate-binding protein